MKKLLGMCGLAAALSLTSVMPLLADDGGMTPGDGPQMNGDGMDGGPHGHRGMGPKMGENGDGDWQVIARFLELKDRLALTDDQIDRLAAVQKEMKDEGKDNRKALGEDFKQLADLVKSNGSDDDIKALLEKMKKDKKAAEMTKEKFMDKIQSVLTPTQQAKMVLDMRPMWGKGMGHWGDHDKGDKTMMMDNGDQSPNSNAPPDSSATPSGN
jgi:Spy/CpxP family protein refolding chaperone